MIEVKAHGNGHINTTYLLRFDFQGKEEKYILQMINKNVFKKPEQVMENIYHVTEHLKKKIEEKNGDVLRETLTVVKTKDGQLYFKDESGDYWREYLCIDNVTSYDSVECKEDFYNSAVSFGNFQKMLSDFPAEKLYETIV